MKFLSKLFCSVMFIAIMVMVINAFLPGGEGSLVDRVLPSFGSNQQTEPEEAIDASSYPTITDLDGLRELVIDHREAGINEFSFIYSRTEKFDALAVAELYGAGHVSWTLQGKLYTVTLTDFPGTRILNAYQRGQESQLEDEEKMVLDKALQIVEDAKAQTEDSLELERILYDALCEEITYYTDDTLLDDGKERPRYVSAIGALIDGKANCQGYTDAFYLVAGLAGFKVGRISLETPTIGHMANTILLNGQWYVVDVTYGDSEEAPVNYRLMNAGMDMIGEYWWDEAMAPYTISETTDPDLYYYYVQDIVYEDLADFADAIVDQWDRTGAEEIVGMVRNEPDGSKLNDVLYLALSELNKACSYRIWYHSNGTDSFYSVILSS